MTKLNEQEIEQLQQELKKKTEEIKVIYDKLVDAGAAPLSDDLLDAVAGGRSHDYSASTAEILGDLLVYGTSTIP